ncbi:MAG: SPOR domain-containing protein [Gammaproteobacteria bacterium]
MDEALLRRLLGATALLALAFLLATLLPAPGDTASGAGTVVYDLRTGEQRGGSPLPPADPPPPAAQGRPEAPAATAPAVASAAPKAEEPPVAPGGWFIQVGSFSSRANARGALQKLFGMGLPTVIQSVEVGKTLWYRVRVGPYPTEAAATAALAKIRQGGFSTAKLVKPDAVAAPGGN